MTFQFRIHGPALLVTVAVLASTLISAQTSSPTSAAQLAEVAARGRMITEYDNAAWHSSDAVQATKPAKGSHTSYIARKLTDGKWVVVFGRFDEAGDKYLISEEAKQGVIPEQFTVVNHEPPLQDQGYYLEAARASKTAREAFTKTQPDRIYNFTILPTGSDEWFVYAIPAQTDLKILPFGGDVRYRISADGATILDTRQMHQAVLEEKLGDIRAEIGFHTHFLSNVPEDSDFFYASARGAIQGELIVTAKYVYEISPDASSVSVLGPTAPLISALEKNDCKLFVREINLCAEGMDGVRKHIIEISSRLLDYADSPSKK